MEIFHKLMITIADNQFYLSNSLTICQHCNIWNIVLGRMQKQISGIINIFYFIFHLNVKKDMLDLDLD